VSKWLESKGMFESWVQCSQCDILLTEKLLFLCILKLQYIYILFCKSEPIVYWIYAFGMI